MAEYIPMQDLSSPSSAKLARSSKPLGILLILGTVLLWTLSNFTTSFIFANDTFDKPFFLTYTTSIPFALSLLPHLRKQSPSFDSIRSLSFDIRSSFEARLALLFAVPFFLSDYLASACLAHTSVTSVTLLTSTSSLWTMLFADEPLTLRTSAAVLASLLGVGLVSTLDFSDAGGGPFLDKSAGEALLGDVMALGSAVIYGASTTGLKRRMEGRDGKEMRVLLGLTGLFIVLLFWPVFFILHWTGVETFELPPTGQVWAIVAFSATSSFIGDTLWSSALLLTTPLLVTVGLSLTIPLSLVGDMLQHARSPSLLYYLGAGVTFASFIFISGDTHEPLDAELVGSV